MSAPTYTVEQLVRIAISDASARLVSKWRAVNFPGADTHVGATRYVEILVPAADAPAVLARLDAQGVGRG